jgi:predicted nucleotidyltransferase
MSGSQAGNSNNLGIDELLGEKREEILALARKHGATEVRVFGSVARGEATPESDIDLLVTFAPDYTLWDHIGLEQELERLLGRKVEVTIEKNLREQYRPFIMQDVRSL